MKLFSTNKKWGDMGRMCIQEGPTGSCSVSGGRYVNRTLLYNGKGRGGGRECHADSVGTVSAAGVTLQVAFEELRLTWANMHILHTNNLTGLQKRRTS